nr:sugar ABC transporter ATP-binding protein [Seinonella peptonophila]
MEDISIEFPGVKALSNATFELETGQIHALIGANGAGKSTLMKVLSGAHDHYTGQIYMNHEVVEIRTPRDAKKLGIDIVQQEVDSALIPYFDVAENIMLDSVVNNSKGKAWVNWSRLHEDARKILERLGTKIDTKKKVSELTLAQKQMVLIARALVDEPRFLILDEPTAPLSQKETSELFRIVKELAAKHLVGIIFISHRLPELFEICDEITVMRNGEVVSREKIDQITPKQVVEQMLGRSMEEAEWKQPASIGKQIFETKQLTQKDHLVKQINMTVHSGEIVGIAGLVGAGKTELCKTIFGVLPIQSGQMLLHGNTLDIHSPADGVAEGLALVPEERRKEGILIDEEVYSNLSAANLSKFCRFGFLKQGNEREAARKMITDLDIKTPSENQKVGLLSGGNQQKVAIGKWLMTDAELFLFDEPTKGVDVGAKSDIFHLISRLAKMGKGIIYATSELAEILAVSDRIYVMYDGMIVKELVTKETNEEEILYYSTGGN